MAHGAAEWSIMMMNSAKNITFIAATIILVLCSAFFITKTVQGQSDTDVLEKEGYYQALEQEYVSEIREYLNEQGFLNSGVTLTRVVDEQGSRDYQVTLHHKYLEMLSEEERQAIFEEIEGMAFGADGCIFQIKLMV